MLAWHSISVPVSLHAAAGSRGQDSLSADAADFPAAHGPPAPLAASVAAEPGASPSAAQEAREEATVGSFTTHSAHAAWAGPHSAPAAALARADPSAVVSKRQLAAAGIAANMTRPGLADNADSTAQVGCRSCSDIDDDDERFHHI